jgi:HD superfamily phosphodiesterase
MRNAGLIMEEERSIHPEAKYDYDIVMFGALLHDMSDEKYYDEGI